MKTSAKLSAALIALSVVFSCQSARASGNHVDEIIAELNKPDSDQVLVVAHRGDWRNHPENSVSCVEGCIEMGVDVVELDVRKTKDGVFVLMHDATVNRTTNGKGSISALTLEQVRRLRLKHKGRVTDERIPTLEEVLEAARGKIMINVDKAGVSKELLELLDRTGTLKQIVFKSGRSADSIAEELGRSEKSKGICFMPIVHSGGLRRIETYLSLTPKPKAVELVFSDPKSEFNTEELLREVRARGLRPWVNTMWASLNGGQTDAKAVKDPDRIWGGLIAKGFNMIQTDNPGALLEYLRGKGLHNFSMRASDGN